MPGKYTTDDVPSRDSLSSRRAMLVGLGGVSIAGVGASVPRTAQLSPVSATPARIPSEEVSITEWGARGGNDPSDTDRIQRALQEAPIGCDLIFPTGYYRITQQLDVRRKVNLVSRGAILSGKLSPGEDLFAINIIDEGNRDNRVMRISGFRTIMNGGKNCIAVYNNPPNVANMGIWIENNILGVEPTAAGHAIHLEGVGTHFNTVINCHIENGILLNCADGTTIDSCVFFGEKVAVTANLISGAFQTRIINNGMVARDGALLVRAGSQITFSGNQVEQFPASGSNRSNASASVAIIPEQQGSRKIRIIGNNFGGGTNVRSSIYAEGDCQDLTIDDNVFGTTASGDDIVLKGKGVAWSRIGPNNTVRGPARGNRAQNMTRPVVQDTGRGTYGARQSSGALAQRATGWVPTADFAFWKDLGGVVRFDGAWRSGPVGPGALIAVVPDGFRPAGPAFLHCGTDVAGEVAVLRVDADGSIRVHRAPTGMIYLNGTSFLAADRAPYLSTDP